VVGRCNIDVVLVCLGVDACYKHNA
jgi:hypothetical protein